MSIAPATDQSRTHNIDVEPLGEDVHVWLLRQQDAGSPECSHDDWMELLSPDETARASRFHFAQHAREFVANRARLRILLASYLGLAPASLVFNYSDLGKPALSHEFGDIFFNLSHTDGMALFAFSQRGRVGVDVEKMVPQDDWLDLAQSHFSEAEVAGLRQMDPIEGSDSFYRCWTRKEAFLKALGDGLSRPLSDFTVSSGSLTAELLTCSWDSSAPASWQLFPLEFDTGYAAALAYEGAPYRLLQSPKVFHGSRSV